MLLKQSVPLLLACAAAAMFVIRLNRRRRISMCIRQTLQSGKNSCVSTSSTVSDDRSGTECSTSSEDTVWGAFVCHNLAECAMEARFVQSELEATLERPVLLDAEVEQDMDIIRARIRMSSVLVLCQSAQVLSQPVCLLEMITAIENDVPIVALRLVAPGPNKYDFEEAADFLRFLDQRLDDEAQQVLLSHGVSLTDAAFKLSTVVPNLISVKLDSFETRDVLVASINHLAKVCLRARATHFTETLDKWLAKRDANQDFSQMSSGDEDPQHPSLGRLTRPSSVGSSNPSPRASPRATLALRACSIQRTSRLARAEASSGSSDPSPALRSPRRAAATRRRSILGPAHHSQQNCAQRARPGPAEVSLSHAVACLRDMAESCQKKSLWLEAARAWFSASSLLGWGYDELCAAAVAVQRLETHTSESRHLLALVALTAQSVHANEGLLPAVLGEIARLPDDYSGERAPPPAQDETT